MAHEDLALQLWTDHIEEASERTLSALVEHYAPLARFLARKAKAKAPAWQALDELVSFAYDGLLDAIQKYDPERAVKFDTYATRRITGAIIDGQRSLDPLSRRQRTAVREYESARDVLELALGRPPTLEELAEELETTVENVRSRVVMVKTSSATILESDSEDDEDEPTMVNDYQAAGAEDLDIEMRMEEIGRLVARAIPRLDDRQQKVLMLYYGESAGFDQISSVLGMHANRCREIRKAMLEELVA